ncbi:MAG: type II secretion system protein M [Proteobacteria bacterium]|nr:type II secretion system protein M [Pseudomonadota bacterium]HQR04199.1 hypothetical protein [Rhodocyclaceae bacterium]
MNAALQARWQQMAQRFAALAPREKWMVAIATVFVIGLGGHTLWVAPASMKAAVIAKQLEQDRNDLVTVRAQLADLQFQAKDPGNRLKRELADTEASLARVNKGLQAYDAQLVPADQMAGLLQTLLSRHRGLRLLSLRTLPPVPLVAETNAGAPSSHPPAAPEGKPATLADGNLYRHGIEIRLAGSYGDLAAYVTELEGAGKKLAWERMSLEIRNYPVNELTLRLYTLSPDSTWLKV